MRPHEWGTRILWVVRRKAVSLSLDNPPFSIRPKRMGHPVSWLGDYYDGAVGGFVFYGLEGFVGLVEGEDVDLRFDVDFGC
jgi:hypothetical protein